MAKTVSSNKSLESKSSPGFLLVVLGILVVGAAVIAIVATQNRSSDSPVASIDVDDSAGPTAPVEVVGDSLPPIAEGEEDPAIGMALPELSGTGVDGSPLKIAEDGKAKAIYFFAHWCPHCQDEVPVVQQLIDDGKKPELLDVYAVSTAVDEGKGNFPPSKWLADEGFTPPVLYDDEQNSALAAVGGTSFPFVVYVDSENKVTGRSSGLPSKEIITRWEAAAAG